MPSCCRCHVEKPDDAFHRRGKTGRQSICKECRRGYHRAHYQRNRERYKTHTRAYQAEASSLIRSLRVRCARCGEDHPAVLDFHHRDPAAKEGTLGSATARGWGEKRIRAEAAKCDVLCSNCHRKLHAATRQLSGAECL